MDTLPLTVTPIYTALFALMFIQLAVYVIKARRSHKVLLLDGGIDELTRNIRAHGNFAEYVPLALVILAMAELNGLHAWALHGLGALLLIGRLIHAYAIKSNSLKHRVMGMSCTFTTLLLGAIGLIATLFL